MKHISISIFAVILCVMSTVNSFGQNIGSYTNTFFPLRFYQHSTFSILANHHQELRVTGNVTGFGNTFYGYDIAPNNTRGSYNTFMGYRAGHENTVGYNNTFIGNYAGHRNTSGIYNTFIGDSSGLNNTAGNYNTFSGTNAGHSNTSGDQNTFTGNRAGYSNTTGSSNTFIGNIAGGSNTTGSSNTFSGSSAGSHNTEGRLNTFIGAGAGNLNTTGSSNTFSGVGAGQSNSTGNYNAFSGVDAGLQNRRGNNNTFSGANAGYNNDGYSNTFIGSRAGGYNLTGNNNTFIGANAGFYNSYGSNNSFFGDSAGYHSSEGRNNTFIGRGATGADSLHNATAIGAFAYAGKSDVIILGGAKVSCKNCNTYVGIGTSLPSHLLALSRDDAAKPGTSTWVTASDSRLKTNIHNYTDGLSILNQVNPVTFEYTGEANMPDKQMFVGVIAQEIQKIAPHMIGKFTGENGREYLSYNANDLIYILVNSVKEQQKTIDNIIAKVTEQDKKISDLEAQMKQALALNKQINTGSITLTGDALLEQNSPNTFTENTPIKYAIASVFYSAGITIKTLEGKELKNYTITKPGKGQLTIPGGTLAAGTYLCELIVDGHRVDSRKMVLLEKN